MKITLISPAVYKQRVYPFWLPPLSLTTIAALTPEWIDVSIVDENVEDIDFNEETDLVGITVLSAMANRAYEIADEFQIKGTKVIMGGFHVSALPEEALQHADSIVIGEAEAVWSQIISDFTNGKLKKIYRSDHFPPLDSLLIPRRDLLKKRAYLSTSTIQTARGCPFNCEFCSIAAMYKRSFRCKPIDNVVEEIKTLPDPFVFIVDDNIVGRPGRAREFFQRIKEFNFQWWSQASITIQKNIDTIKLAAESGCFLLIVGIESLSETSINSIGKHVNRIEEYESFIELMHEHNIMLNLSFVFGLDGDSDDVFEKTIDFLRRTKTALATFNVQTPYPGTRLFDRLDREGRIIHRDWSKYDGGHVVYQPAHMSPEALQEGYDWAVRQFYSNEMITERIKHTPRHLANLMFQWNRGYKKMLDAFGVILG